ncbi:MAG: hypothetical protein IJT63_05065 [Lachnospiraceae bacterium]|nr:hypothetical protein [Lachnospiraceae bacterium]
MSNDKCFISYVKIREYLLNPAKKHAAEFFNVGYSVKNVERLKRDIENQFDFSKAVDFQKGYEDSEKFSIMMILGIKNRKRFRSVWQKDDPDSIPRLITVFRED